VSGVDYPVKLGYDKLVFVFEDIDAASEVVQKRASTAPTRKTSEWPWPVNHLSQTCLIHSFCMPHQLLRYARIAGHEHI
jgi:hypothetical protein